MLTLLASTLGAWILFSPAQAATWGGLAAVIGYAIGALSPRFLMIPLGRRMRELIPQGHTLTEFVIMRYGRPMYGLTLLIMLFYIDRKSVVSGKSGSVRVDLGGSGIIKKKQKHTEYINNL